MRCCHGCRLHASTTPRTRCRRVWLECQVRGFGARSIWASLAASAGNSCAELARCLFGSQVLTPCMRAGAAL